MAARKKNERRLASRVAREPEELAGTRSIRRTCAILRLVGQSSDSGVTLPEVAAASGLPKSSAHRYLLVLGREGFVERDEVTQHYHLGLSFIALHTRQADWLIERARPLMEKLRDECDESVNLGMLQGNSVIYLDIAESPRAIRLAARRGDLDHIHATALGKVIAATFSDDRVLNMLRTSGMPKRTARTITDPHAYLEELAQVRSKGYAVDDCENEADGRCVAVFVPGLGAPVAISVSGVASRFPMSNIPKIARALFAMAATLSGADARLQATEAANRRSGVRRKRGATA